MGKIPDPFDAFFSSSSSFLFLLQHVHRGMGPQHLCTSLLGLFVHHAHMWHLDEHTHSQSIHACKHWCHTHTHMDSAALNNWEVAIKGMAKMVAGTERKLRKCLQVSKNMWIIMYVRKRAPHFSGLMRQLDCLFLLSSFLSPVLCLWRAHTPNRVRCTCKQARWTGTNSTWRLSRCVGYYKIWIYKYGINM